MHKINLTLVYFLVFSLVSSALAYYIVVKAYDGFEDSDDQVTYYLES